MSPSPPGLRKGERTRAAILEAVVALVNLRPVGEIKIADILEKAGLTVGAFYFHFKGKDEALVAAGSEGVRSVFEALTERPPADDLHSEIFTMLDGFYQSYLEKPNLVRAIYLILAEHRPVRIAWLEARARLQARLVQRLGQARQSGAIGPSALGSDYVMAGFLLGAVERFYDEAFFAPPDARFGREAGSHDVFVRQQALMWMAAISGKTE